MVQFQEAYRALCDALFGMERVAEHINEMQRIHEEYGAIFDHLFRQHQKALKSVSHTQCVKHNFTSFARNTRGNKKLMIAIKVAILGFSRGKRKIKVSK